MGRLPIYVYPFAIGFGYLMPLEWALSFWFFYLFWGAQRVFFSATGWTTAIGLQGVQRGGAWLGIVRSPLLQADAKFLKSSAVCFPLDPKTVYIDSPSLDY